MSENGIGNISHSENMEKRAAKAKAEFEHALAMKLHSRSVESLERQTTVELFMICGFRTDGVDVSTYIDH